MQISSKSIFISDLHLTQKNELIKNSFFSFLDNFPNEVHNLFIVGDLFDLWIGDDVRNDLVENLHSKLKKISDNQKRIFFVSTVSAFVARVASRPSPRAPSSSSTDEKIN